MRDKIKGAVIAAVVLVALAIGGAAIAGAAGGGGDDDGNGKPITGTALDHAKAVALDHTGGGRVSATEANDEEGAYEVEVTRADGSQVDVHLDKSFKVIDSSRDGGDHQGEAGDQNDGGD